MRTPSIAGFPVIENDGQNVRVARNASITISIGRLSQRPNRTGRTLTDTVISWLIENSPPESGPVYLALAEHWYLLSPLVILFLAFVVVVLLTFTWDMATQA